MEARQKRMLEYNTTPLEAFAVLAYKNGFTRWSEEFHSNDDGSAESNINSKTSSLMAGSRSGRY
jgi:hypothetical protein